MVFDPTNPKRAFSTHDGGISVTNNIEATPVVWQDLNNSYNVTQFYTVSLHPDKNDRRIMGGTQDNGTPYFLFNLSGTSGESEDASSGDGAYSYLGEDYALTSSQNGFLLRFDYQVTNLVNFSYVKPKNATNQLFIHPYAVNPVNENYVFYPEGNHLWRNNSMKSIPRNSTDSEGTTTGWKELTELNVGNDGHEITALAFSKNSPSNRLYFAGSSTELIPVIKRLDDITLDDGEVDISIAGADPGAYVHDIAVNPVNGNEVIVVMSNYSVESLWYTNNAGENWTAIGGNLEGENGPSVRTAAIVPTNAGETYYFAGTSVGLFVTDNLDGSNTQWEQVAKNEIGNAVVAEMDYRMSDGLLAVATHGRGIFIGEISMSTSNEPEPITTLDSPGRFQLAQNFPNPFNPSTNIRFQLPTASTVQLTVYDLNGRTIATIYQDKQLGAGQHSVSFNASSLSSGTYFYRMEAQPVSGGSAFTQTRRMTLIK